MITEHDLKMSFNDGYEAGYEDGINANENGLSKTEIFLAVMSAIFGFTIAIGLCKFVPGFWEFIVRGFI